MQDTIDLYSKNKQLGFAHFHLWNLKRYLFARDDKTTKTQETFFPQKIFPNERTTMDLNKVSKLAQNLIITVSIKGYLFGNCKT